MTFIASFCEAANAHLSNVIRNGKNGLEIVLCTLMMYLKSFSKFCVKIVLEKRSIENEIVKNNLTIGQRGVSGHDAQKINNQAREMKSRITQAVTDLDQIYVQMVAAEKSYRQEKELVFWRNIDLLTTLTCFVASILYYMIDVYVTVELRYKV